MASPVIILRMPLEGGVSKMNEVLMTNRAVDLTRLKKGTVLLIETNGSVYEAISLDPPTKLFAIIGGGERFIIHTEVNILGCLWGKDRRPNWLEIGMAMEIVPTATPNRMITTSAIKSLKIQTEGYSYEL